MLKICVICVLCSESLNRLKALMGHNVHHVSGLCRFVAQVRLI